MKVVVLGYGSIGSRHARILKNNLKIKNIFIFSKQKIKKYKSFSNLAEIKKINPNYVVIANNTRSHFFYLKYLENNFKNIIILVEKPLFHRQLPLRIKNNKVFVGYNMRFHPVIRFLKEKLLKDKIIDIKMIANSYLPNWRKKIKYYKCYSAHKKLGGGVILDLSHELDLANWLFGKIKVKYSLHGKFSKLKINTEDTLKLYGKIKRSNFSLDLSYYSHVEIRKILVNTEKNSIHADISNNFLIIKGNNLSKKINYSSFNIDSTYIDQHKAILFNKNKKILCDYKSAVKLQKLIEFIKKNKGKHYQ